MLFLSLSIPFLDPLWRYLTIFDPLCLTSWWEMQAAPVALPARRSWRQRKRTVQVPSEIYLNSLQNGSDGDGTVTSSGKTLTGSYRWLQYGAWMAWAHHDSILFIFISHYSRWFIMIHNDFILIHIYYYFSYCIFICLFVPGALCWCPRCLNYY